MQLEIGQSASLTRKLTQEDFNRFAHLSGDDNPIHIDPEFAARTRFGRPVAHGMLLYSLISNVLGNQLPGAGTLQVRQELKFPTPTYLDEEVTVRVQVSMLHKGGVAHLDTTIFRPRGEVACEGQTLLKIPGEPLAPFHEIQWPGEPAEAQLFESEAESLNGLTLGQKATLKRRFSSIDLVEYVELSGDRNPIFTDGDYAKRHGHPAPLVPGALLGSLFSFLLGKRLPGPGTNWLKQKLAFPNPIYQDEEILAQVEIVRLRPGKNLVNLRTTCRNTKGELVCDGEALVLVKDVSKV